MSYKGTKSAVTNCSVSLCMVFGPKIAKSRLALRIHYAEHDLLDHRRKSSHVISDCKQKFRQELIL